VSGTNGLPPEQLRALVREVLADVVAKLPPQPPAPLAHPTNVPAGGAIAPPAGTLGEPQAGAWTVRISSDEDLHAFALRVLRLAGNPKLRQDLISGRARFRLAGGAAGPGDPPGHGPAASGQSAAAQRVEKGAVTERMVAAAAAAGARLVLGPRAVLTPLAKDKARALGVPITEER